MTFKMKNPAAGTASGAEVIQNFRDEPIIHRLANLPKFKKLSTGRYVACCPVHGDKHPSLSITQKPDGVWVLHCFSCGANGQAVCDSLGIDVTSLFPPSDNRRYEKQHKQGFSAWQLLQCLEKDLIVIVAAADMLRNGEVLPDSDRQYLSEVILRVNDGLRYLEGKQ